jgi:hypothetical protein
MLHTEATAGQIALNEWARKNNDPRLTVRIVQTTGKESNLRVTHPAYAAPVIMADTWEVDAWIAGSPILAQPNRLRSGPTTHA